jgi:putative transposase
MAVFKTSSSANYRLIYRLGLITRRRRRYLSEAMLSEIQAVCLKVLSDWGCELTEFTGGAHYVLLCFGATPSVAPARLVNRLKTATSRELRKRQRLIPPDELSQGAGEMLLSGLWARSYVITSAEGAKREQLQRYVWGVGSNRDAGGASARGNRGAGGASPRRLGTGLPRGKRSAGGASG